MQLRGRPASIEAPALGLAFCAGTALASQAFGQQVADNREQVADNLETVTVNGERTGFEQLPSTIQDTPQSIDVVTRQVMKDQATSTLQDALRNVPGLTLNAGEGGSHGDSVNLRGFAAGDDLFLDGIRDTGTYFRDSFNLESVDVLEGPASTLFGRGSTGGVINQISKMPTMSPEREATATFGTNAELRGTADLDQPIAEDAAFRVNLMGERTDVADRDYVRNRRFGFAPSVAWGLHEDTTVTLAYFHQEEDDVPDYGIPYLFNGPAPVPRNTFYGLASDDVFQTNVNVMTAVLKHRFTDALSLTETLRYGNYWMNSRISAPHYGDDDTRGDGEPPPPSPGLSPADILTLRDRPSVEGTTTNLTSQTAATYDFATGPVAHTLVVGVEASRETSDLTRYANQIDQIPGTPVLDPDPNEPFPGTQTKVSSRPSTTGDTIAGFLLETMHIGPQWDVIGGFRYDRFDANYDEPVSRAHFERVDTMPSPRAAIVFKPTPQQSLYFSYGTSFNPSAENLSLSSKNANLAPEKDRTYELGAKSQFLGGLLSATGAVFDTEMTNARVADPDDPLLQQLSGSQRVRGFELGVEGHLTERWSVLAGYTYLDAKTIASTAPAQIGEFLPNTARNAANLWTTYEIDDAWKIGTGINWLGHRFADMAGQVGIPSYVVWNAMAGYQVTDEINVQVNVYNITNAYYYTNSYYSSALENHVVPGAGRTATLTASFEF